MVRLAVPGLAFALPTAVGRAVGVVTHAVPRIGSLVWIARPTFESLPSPADVAAIAEWRWPVFFLAGTAIRRKVADRIGIVPVPESLRDFPMLRGGGGPLPWMAVKFVDGESRTFGLTTDRSLPIYQIVNDVALREMIEGDWRPEDEF